MRPDLTERGWSSVPAGDGVVVVLVQQEPVPVAAAAVDEDEATGQLLAAQVDVDIAGVDGGLRVVTVGEGPGAQSQTMTSPPPYSPAGITPSKSK